MKLSELVNKLIVIFDNSDYRDMDVKIVEIDRNGTIYDSDICVVTVVDYNSEDPDSKKVVEIC